jgi:hypothetical protein
MKTKQQDVELSIIEVSEASLELYLVGRTPLIINRMAEKAKQELLMPKGKKTAADKASNLKHDPIAEYRSSAYTIIDEKAATYIGMPAAAPKRAIASAALDIPGAKKSQIGRLVYVKGEILGVYGTPKMFMSITRSADMAKTPDVRTRCIVDEWALRMTVSFVVPIVKPQMVLRLINAAGIYIGIGDWRPEKGAGNYGQFRPVALAEAKNDEQLQRILKAGRSAQKHALQNPEFYNAETEELFSWFASESKVRGFAATA